MLSFLSDILISLNLPKVNKVGKHTSMHI